MLGNIDSNHHHQKARGQTESSSVSFNEGSVERSEGAFTLSRTILPAHILQIFIRWHSHRSQLIKDRPRWSSRLNEPELKVTHPTATYSEQMMITGYMLFRYMLEGKSDGSKDDSGFGLYFRHMKSQEHRQKYSHLKCSIFLLKSRSVMPHEICIYSLKCAVKAGLGWEFSSRWRKALMKRQWTWLENFQHLIINWALQKGV